MNLKGEKELTCQMELKRILSQMDLFMNKEVKVDYDKKSFVGTVKDIFRPEKSDWNNGVMPGFIISDEKGRYKHIKIHRVKKVVEINRK